MPGQSIEPLAVSVAQAVQISGLSRSAIYRELGAGRLRAVKRGARTLVMVDSIRRYLAGLPEARFRSRGLSVSKSLSAGSEFIAVGLTRRVPVPWGVKLTSNAADWDAADVPEWVALPDVPRFMVRLFDHSETILVPEVLASLKRAELIHRVSGLVTISSPSRRSLPQGFSAITTPPRRVVVTEWDAVTFDPQNGTVQGWADDDRHTVEVLWRSIEHWEFRRRVYLQGQAARPSIRHVVPGTGTAGRPTLAPLALRHMEERATDGRFSPVLSREIDALLAYLEEQQGVADLPAPIPRKKALETSLREDHRRLKGAVKARN